MIWSSPSGGGSRAAVGCYESGAVSISDLPQITDWVPPPNHRRVRTDHAPATDACARIQPREQGWSPSCVHSIVVVLPSARRRLNIAIVGDEDQSEDASTTDLAPIPPTVGAHVWKRERASTPLPRDRRRRGYTLQLGATLWQAYGRL